MSASNRGLAIADAVAKLLQEWNCLPEGASVARGIIAEFPKEVDTTAICVVLSQHTSARNTRRHWLHEYRVGVGVRQRVASDSEANDVLGLAEKVGDYLRCCGAVEACDRRAVLTEVEAGLAYDHQLYREEGIVATLINLTYEVET